MLRTICLLLLSVVFSSINQSLAGIFWEIDKETVIDTYLSSKKSNVYRGLLFSFTTDQKRKLCEDHFSSQLYILTANENIGDDPSATAFSYMNDEQQSEGKPQFPLAVRRLVLYRDRQKYTNYEELFYECVGPKSMQWKSIKDGHFHIASAHLTGRWFSSILITENKFYSYAKAIFNFGESAEHVPMEQNELEEHYMRIWKQMKALEGESGDYVKLLEQEDNLSALTTPQLLHVCNSILSSAIFRKDLLEYWPNWLEDFMYTDLKYEKKILIIENKTFDIELQIECILCMGFKIDNINPVNLFLTRSYDHHDSLYVVRQSNGGVRLWKYFRKISTLTNALIPIRKDSLRRNVEFLTHLNLL